VRRALVVLAVASLVGCYDHFHIRPEAVPEISGAYTDVGSIPTFIPMGNGLVMTSLDYIKSESAIELETVEGEKVTMKGAADLEITTAAGRWYRFDHPLRASLGDDVLDIRAANRSGRIRVADVGRAEVRHLNRWKTVLAATLGALAATVPVLFLVVK
jgi:hypothetical protein